jgi:hypothetical protein
MMGFSWHITNQQSTFWQIKAQSTNGVAQYVKPANGFVLPISATNGVYATQSKGMRQTCLTNQWGN